MCSTGTSVHIVQQCSNVEKQHIEKDELLSYTYKVTKEISNKVTSMSVANIYNPKNVAINVNTTHTTITVNK